MFAEWLSGQIRTKQMPRILSASDTSSSICVLAGSLIIQRNKCLAHSEAEELIRVLWERTYILFSNILIYAFCRNSKADALGKAWGNSGLPDAGKSLQNAYCPLKVRLRLITSSAGRYVCEWWAFLTLCPALASILSFTKATGNLV